MKTKMLTEKDIIAAVLRGGGLPGIPTETVCGPDAGESGRTARYIREKMGEHTEYISGFPGCAGEAEI